MSVFAANAAWVASCLPGWQRFARAAENPQAAQEQLLRGYLQANAHTEYGEKHGFARIASPAQYQAQVPLTRYDDYSAFIERIGDGQPNQLTATPVRMFELSSGSTAASKLIPYTAQLKEEFQRGIAPWIYNLYTHHPQLLGGPAYWSVTPLTDGRKTTPGGLPIGFETDSAYLGPLGQWLVNRIMAVPDAVKNIAKMDAFRYATLLHLLRHPDLRLISVWNPTFLSLLLEKLPLWWDKLLQELAEAAPHPALARRLSGISPTDFKSIWPRLTILSCWTDGPSVPYALQLAAQFPGVTMQGKGLLATEAFVSFPLVGVEGAALAINSHFFEFTSQTGEPLLAHQLQKGQSYSVVVTTGGGFYRYQLHDTVEVLGFWKKLPLLRFLGKADHISDWFGEKLEEQFVARALQESFDAYGITPIFAMLAPETDSKVSRLSSISPKSGDFGLHSQTSSISQIGYTLFLESDSPFDSAYLAETLDRALRQNFHYDYCRRLGQLGPVEIVRVRHAAESYLKACQQRGQKLGNIKPSVLQKTSGWKEQFEIIHSAADKSPSSGGKSG